MTMRRRTISAADANRKFSEVLRDVRNGSSVVVTVHGKAVARIVGIDDRGVAADDSRETLLARLTTQRAMGARSWTRESLYREDA
jgi:prevent-host-death family protein